MPDFLKTVASPVHSPLEVLTRLVLAVLLGLTVGWVYKRTREASEITASFPATIVMLSVLIAMVAQVIGESPARAFSLVGALSIVRFRTVVRDTQDTAFVIFAVVVGMAAGVTDVWVSLIGLVTVSVTAFIVRRRHSAHASDAGAFTLTVRIGLGHDIQILLGPTFEAHLAERALLSMETAKQGMSIDAAYDVRFRSGGSPDGLVTALNRLEGVQDVKVKRRGGDDDDD